MNMLNFERISAAVLAIALAASSGVAQAATTIATGSGSVTSTATSRLNATIDARGASVSFLAQFDPALATLIAVPNGMTRVYDLSATSIAATIGGHSLNLDPNTLESAVLIIGTGFQPFGGPVTEAVLIEEFRFTAGPGRATSPARLNGLPPLREIISFSFSFRTGTDLVPATIESLRDPAQADRGSFSYRADTGTFAAPAAIANGSAIGALTIVSPVPEPQTWVLLIMGFFMAGTALRRHHGARAVA